MRQTFKKFTYSVRVSARARHIRLAVNPYSGLEVVIPKRFPQRQIARILQQHDAWITRQLEKHDNSLQGTTLPDAIRLCVTATEFRIVYHQSERFMLNEQRGLLCIEHNSQQQVIQALRRWVRLKAKEILPAMLDELARQLGFEYRKVIIRSQKSRWGSCSSKGTISLNDQLLFMPAATVRYLMIHELCHTRFMNHSAAFWRLVETCCPDYRRQDRYLSQGRDRVPHWFSRSLFAGQ